MTLVQILQICLVVYLASEILQFLNNLMVVRRNYKTLDSNNEILRDQVDRLKKDLDDTKDQLKISNQFTDALIAGRYDTTCWAMTMHGLKALPKGWEKALLPLAEEAQKSQTKTTKENKDDK